MLRSIGKQSGESVKSVKKKKREACFDLPAIGTLNLSVYFLASVNMLAGTRPSSPLRCQDYGFRRSVVVSGVRRMNEVNARRARLVLGWVTVFGRVYHLGM